MSETIHVTVTRVLYPKPGADWPAGTWCIIRTDCGCAKGEMSWRPGEGERLKLTGTWGVYKGQREFKFDAAVPDIPIDPRDQLRYICDTTAGLGPVIEAAIWEQWGAD